MEDLVVIKTFLQRYEAEHAQGLLKNNGIDSIVQADDLGGFRSHLTLGTGNVRLLVKKEHAEKAKEILSILDRVVPESDLEKAYKYTYDENTYSESPKSINLPSKRKILNLVLGVLLIWLSVYIYNNQEPTWKDSFVQGSHFVIEVESKGNTKIDDENTNRIKKIYEYRLKGLGLRKRERLVEIIEDRTIAIQLPHTPLSDFKTRILFKIAKLEFKLVEDNPNLIKAALDGDIPTGLILEHIERNNEDEPILLSENVVLKGSIIKDAEVEVGRTFNMPTIMLVFNKKGASTFAEITSNNTGKRLAIILDGEVLSAPRIHEPILKGRAQITGTFTKEEATLLAVALRAGIMPAEIRVVESAQLTKELWLGK